MKAVVCTGYGGPEKLELREVPKPSPKRSDILIKVKATTVTAGDCRMRRFHCPPMLWIPARIILGIFRPRKNIFGMEIAGVVEAVGAEVERFVPGDEVFASTEMLLGGYAEYCCLPENIAIAKKPQNMSYEEAAAVPTGALTAWYFLQKTKIRAHQNQGQLKVLIYGASGSVGTFALQLSSLWGAGVTGVCSGANLELVKSLGANRVLDYTKTNISQVEDRYDIIFDCVGKLTKAAARPLLRNNGEYVSVESGEVSQFTYHNLEEIQALIEEGRLKSVIDRSYDLEDIRQAHSYVERGHKIGNVAIGIS